MVRLTALAAKMLLATKPKSFSVKYDINESDLSSLMSEYVLVVIFFTYAMPVVTAGTSVDSIGL